MKKPGKTFFLSGSFLVLAAVALIELAPPPIPESAKHQVTASYGNLPLSFEANQGQTDPQVKFLSRGRGYSLFLTATEAVLALQGLNGGASRARVPDGQAQPAGPASSVAPVASLLRIRLAGANPAGEIRGEKELPGKSNYFIGNDPSKWRTSVPHYGKVRYELVYPGVDLVYYGTPASTGQLEYDFVVAPGADPGAIGLAFDGASRLELDSQGDLVISLTADGARVTGDSSGFTDQDLRLHKPVIYQETGGGRREISGGYVLTNEHEVSFRVAHYDASLPLVIDPVLVYSTYFGGSGNSLAVIGDKGSAIALDAAGDAYVTGSTSSNDFPTTPGAFQAALGSRNYVNAFVTKLNATGTALVYSTYLGGSFGSFDGGSAIALDSAGNAYVTGSTSSNDFPTTPGAFQTTLRGRSNAFVTKLNPTGSALLYSTYLGGSGFDVGSAIALDSAGNAYVTGSTSSNDFPTTAGVFQSILRGPANAFVTKLNATGTALVYSTYLGGSGTVLPGIATGDQGSAIALDAAGDAYVTGSTTSADFPTTPGAFQAALRSSGGGNAIVTKLNATGTALVYSTYLGGSRFDAGNAIALDSAGNAYVTGSTHSSDFPTTPGAFQAALRSSDGNAFVTKLNATGTALLYSTYLGGSGQSVFGSGDEG